LASGTLAVLSYETAPTEFMVDAGRIGLRRSYRYLCGACGTPLFDHATLEILECVFLRSVCCVVNEAPIRPEQLIEKARKGESRM
jgi:hypothetical protein